MVFHVLMAAVRHGKHRSLLRALLSMCLAVACHQASASMPTDDGRAAGALRLLFTGDVMLGRDVAKFIQYNGADRLFVPATDSVLAAADVVVANLECPATAIVSPVNKRFVFRADPALLTVLARHGVTHLNLANNHSIDQGRRGLKDTYRNIVAAGMVPIGYGDNADEAALPTPVVGGPRPIYILSSLRVMSENYVHMAGMPGVCEASVGQLCDSIAAIKHRQPSACVVVCLHWGVEHTRHPMAEQRQEARQLVLAGADAVIGHHSHTAQDVETYLGRPIFYSLGNFIFDLDRPLNRDALLAELTVTANGLDFRAIPIEIVKCCPRPVVQP